MVKPEIIEGVLHLEVEGMDKVWSFKSRLSIPLEHITGARTDDKVVDQFFHGLKMPGSNIPHVITAGTYYQAGKRVFWDIHNPRVAVVISLNHERYDELVVEVESPISFVEELMGKLARRPK